VERRDSFEGYDVLIDDAYVPGKGLVPCVNVPPCFSKKGVHLIDHHPLFLHPRESREFSSCGTSFRSLCKCMVCTAISVSVPSYDDYLLVRRSCFELGFLAETCVSGLLNHDLQNKGMVKISLDTLPSVPVRKGKDARALLSLSEEIPIAFRHDSAQQRGVRGFQQFAHSEGFEDSSSKYVVKRFDHLAGREVYFSGVPSSILGQTHVRSVKGANAFPQLLPDTVCFVENWDAYDQVQGCVTVYFKGSKKDLLTKFPDRRCTGRMVGSYQETVRSFSDVPVPFRDVSRSRTFPVPYQWFLEFHQNVLLASPCVARRNGDVIQCDRGPLPHSYDLCSFFSPNLKYSETFDAHSEIITYFPVSVVAGVAVITESIEPVKRDPDSTLWRSADLEGHVKHWGFVSRSSWQLAISAFSYWVMSPFVVHHSLRIGKKNYSTMFPRAWEPDLVPWLSQWSSDFYPKGSGVHPTLGQVLPSQSWSAPSMNNWVCSYHPRADLLLLCCACKKDKAKSCYSGSQLKKNDLRRCLQCVG